MRESKAGLAFSFALFSPRSSSHDHLRLSFPLPSSLSTPIQLQKVCLHPCSLSLSRCLADLRFLSPLPRVSTPASPTRPVPSFEFQPPPSSLLPSPLPDLVPPSLPLQLDPPHPHPTHLTRHASQTAHHRSTSDPRVGRQTSESRSTSDSSSDPRRGTPLGFEGCSDCFG